MLSQAEIHTALTEELGSNLTTLLPSASVCGRWFNEGQSRLQWYKHDVLDVSWSEGDVKIDFADPVIEVAEVLYPEDAREKRWSHVQGGLLIEDYAGAREDGDAKVVVRTYWNEVTDSVPSELPTSGDAACLSYCLYRFFRRITADRSMYQRYSTLMGENGVSLDDLADTADDHYRDFLDHRNDLPSEPAAVFYPEG
jgi:hypothetical protein